MKTAASASCLALLIAGGAWHYRSNIETATTQFLVGQTKRILKQELRQEKNIDIIAGNLESVVQRFVLDNQQVKERTAELMHQLFQVERVKKVFIGLFYRALLEKHEDLMRIVLDAVKQQLPPP
mmetsp:Transcript_9473/g.18283  ORF Transcript_9473/g.18283 Transcript_9473/m.18283 type:complete len:124 (+) Transcript_9473:754-1125(+)